MTQRQLNPNNEFGPTQSKPATGNAEASRVAAASAKVLEKVRLRDLPTKKERLLALADALEAHVLVERGIGFNMGPYYRKGNNYEDQTGHNCNTAACIAGWASLIDNPNIHREEHIISNATKVLGLDPFEVNYFFTGEFSVHTLAKISLKSAVAALRDYAETGVKRYRGFDNEGRKIR